MMLPSDSSLQRFLAFLGGNADGSVLERLRFYLFRIILGGIVGFMIVAMATPARTRKADGFPLELYLGAAVVGAVAALAFAIVPRLLHPKDWPTREEFRRGAQRRDERR